MGDLRRGRRLRWRTESGVKDGICGIPALLGLVRSRWKRMSESRSKLDRRRHLVMLGSIRKSCHLSLWCS